MSKDCVDRLPPGWETARLGDLGLYHNGRGFKKSEWAAHGRPIIRIQDLTGSGSTPNYFTGEADSRHEVQPGDLLVSWAATLGVYIWHGPPAVLNQHIFKVDSFISKAFHFFAIKYILASLYAKAHGSGMVHVIRSKFESENINVPPLPEQHRIVEALDSYLSRLDAGEEGLKRVEANLKRYRASVLKGAVEGRLVPTEAELARQEGRDYEPASVLLERILKERRRRWEEAELAKMEAKGKVPKNDKWKARYKEPGAPDTSELPELPEGWCWSRAEQLSEFITKGTTPKKSQMTAGTGDVPYIKVYNLTFTGLLDFSVKPTFVEQEIHRGFLLRSVCRPGDVLMNIVGPPLGKVSIVPNSYPEWNINQAVVRYRPIDGVSAEYLSVVLRSEAATSWAKRQAKATAGQFNLTLEISRNLPVPLAPEQEQSRIVEKEQHLLSLESHWLADVELANRRLGRLHQSILRWAFKGKLVDQDPNDEPASALLERIQAERPAASRRRGRNRRK